MNAQPTTPDLVAQPDPRLAAAVDVARAAAEVDAQAVTPAAAPADAADPGRGDRAGSVVGRHVAVHAEDGGAATHFFEAHYPGYRGWRWAVTVAHAGADTPVTVSEVVLLPGPDALVAPDWVPWDQRVRAGDLGVGDLLPTAPDDPRLAPAYQESDDPAIEETVREVGLGRPRVLSREGRSEAAQRWSEERGPLAEMAASAPSTCGSCGFYLPLAGSLGAAFGVCANEYAPADGRAVHAEFGCGAHSEVEVEPVPAALIADVVYDDAQLDLVPAARTSTEATATPPADVPGDEVSAVPGDASDDEVSAAAVGVPAEAGNEPAPE
ncbi:MAG TPA: DUF3027 domain-containing protein [Pseudonocardiaceae bacterium]